VIFDHPHRSRGRCGAEFGRAYASCAGTAVVVGMQRGSCFEGQATNFGRKPSKQAIESKTGRVQLVTFPDAGLECGQNRGAGGSPAPRQDRAAAKRRREPRFAENRHLCRSSEGGRCGSCVGKANAFSGMPVQPGLGAGDASSDLWQICETGRVSILRGARGFRPPPKRSCSAPGFRGRSRPRRLLPSTAPKSSHGGRSAACGARSRGGPQGPHAGQRGGGVRWWSAAATGSTLAQNRALGRAYLAQMYRRLRANWARCDRGLTNWGPGPISIAWDRRRAGPWTSFPLRSRAATENRGAARGPVPRRARHCDGEPVVGPLGPGGKGCRLPAPGLPQRSSPTPCSAGRPASNATPSRGFARGPCTAGPADWKSAYAAFGAGRIVSPGQKKRARDSAGVWRADYAATFEPAD